MTTIFHTRHTPTLSEIPFAITAILQRNARREAKARRSWWRRAAKRMHSVRIGTETIESNLPLR